MKYLKKFENLNKEIDDILDKINVSGLESLSSGEKMKLDNAFKPDFDLKEHLIKQIKEKVKKNKKLRHPVLYKIQKDLKEIHTINMVYENGAEVRIHHSKEHVLLYSYMISFDRLDEHILEKILEELQ